MVFESIKNAVANISKVNYYAANLERRVKCDASHNGLGATLEQQKDEGCSCYLQLFGQLTDTNITF